MEHLDSNRTRGERRSTAWLLACLLLLWGLAVGWLTLEAVALVG